MKKYNGLTELGYISRLNQILILKEKLSKLQKEIDEYTESVEKYEYYKTKNNGK